MKLLQPHEHLAARSQALNRPHLALFGGIVAVVGAVVLMSTFAAGTPVAFEAETGVLTGGAAAQAIAGASGGSAVRFAAAATPTPTPTPTAGPVACAPYPSFPDASCTGPTGTLTTYTGSQTFNTPGQVIENVIINTSGFAVGANNITFRNCKIIMKGADEFS